MFSLFDVNADHSRSPPTWSYFDFHCSPNYVLLSYEVCCVVLYCVIKKSLTFKMFWMKWNGYSRDTVQPEMSNTWSQHDQKNVNKLPRFYPANRRIFERTFSLPLKIFLLATRGPLRDPFYIKLVEIIKCLFIFFSLKRDRTRSPVPSKLNVS